MRLGTPCSASAPVESTTRGSSGMKGRRTAWLPAAMMAYSAPKPQSMAFANWVGDALERDDRPALLDYRRLAPYGAEAHPSEEHLLPLFAALGAANPGEKPLRLEPETTYGGLAMDAYLWQDASPAPFTPEH